MKKTIYTLPMVLLALVMSCSQPPPNTVQLDVFKIQGDVYLPARDTTLVASSLPLSSWILGAPVQAATGLIKAGKGLEVRLIRIDDTGKQISKQAVATATTDANGHYSLEVPTKEATLPATDMIVEVGRYETGAYLRNFASAEKLDLSPMSTGLVQYLVDRSEPLFAVPLTVVEQANPLVTQSTQSVDFSTVNLATAVSNALSTLKANSALKSKVDELLSRVVSGTVIAPNGQIAAVPTGFQLQQWISPPAMAAAGLQAVGNNVLVSLNRIDDNGNVQGQPLVSTRTRSDGRYAFSLPEGLTFSTQAVVSVGSGPTLMRSFLMGSANLNLSPLSELATRAVLDNGSLLQQPKIPISEFSPPELILLQDAIQRSVGSSSVLGVGNINAALAVLQPVAFADTAVLTALRGTAGIPAATIDPLPPATSKDTIAVSGTVRAGSTVTIEGGAIVVQKSLAATETRFSLDVPLKRNTTHKLVVRASSGGTVSLPSDIALRQDTINPTIDIAKIVARKPSGASFQTEITGAEGSIGDTGRSTVTITNSKLNTNTTVQTDNKGAFSTTLTADPGDALNVTAVDEAGNLSSATIVVGSPGPVILDISPQSTGSTKILSLQGSGFSTTLSNNVITFTSPTTSLAVNPLAVDPDGKGLTAAVPSGLVKHLTDLPVTIKVKAAVSGVESNINKDFVLVPAVLTLNQSMVNGNGEAEYMAHDTTRQSILVTTQLDTQSRIMNFDLNGIMLNSNIAQSLDHESIFRDLVLDKAGNLVVANFSTRVLGKDPINSAGRPTYRLTKYGVTGTQQSMALLSRLAESTELGSRPGAMAYNPLTNLLYVVLPEQNRIMKIDYSSETFGRPQEFLTGVPSPIKDIMLDSTGKVMYVSLGDSVSVFRLTLNGSGDMDLINSNFATSMGSGNGRLTQDDRGNIYVTLGTGVNRITAAGQKINLINNLEGNRPSVGVLFANNNLFVNQLNTPAIFRIIP